MKCQHGLEIDQCAFCTKPTPIYSKQHMGDKEFNEPDAFPKIGPLKYLGYQVGVRSISLHERHNILTAAFKNRLPEIEREEYMEKWGEPNTEKRLKRIAYSIDGFIGPAKRKKDPPWVAIEHWEEDLEWLKNKFYDDRFTFMWPGDYIQL